jgi:Icc-related predicted phosphoesterase
MKIALASDLHLEYGTLSVKNPGDVEVLILSGDILVERDLNELQSTEVDPESISEEYHAFFKECSKEFPHVVYVAGNHEHYHGDFKHTISGLKTKLAYLTNVHILDKEVFKLGDYTFVGSTLWTDMNREDPLTLHHMKKRMNDFKIIKNSNRELFRWVPVYEYDEEGNVKLDDLGRYVQIGTKRKSEPAFFSPEDVVEENKRCIDYIKQVVSQATEGEKIVVVGHHTPSHQSCSPYYKDDYILNGAYHNSYEEYIMDHPQIVLWTHGHTHERYDYLIGDTRIACNPRGYIGYENIADNFDLMVMEI